MLVQRLSTPAAKIIGLGILVVVLFGLERRFQLSSLLGPERIDSFLQQSGPLAPAVFILAMATAIVVSPIPTLPLDILAGRMFGPVLGTFYAALGAGLGALASFHIARFLGREFLARFLKGHINFCRRCSDKLLTKVVFLSRLLPFVSFDLVSYGAGLTNMSAWKFGLASFLGMLPLTFLYTSYGAVLLDNRAVAWIGGVGMVALFFLLPRWIERYDLFSMGSLLRHDDEKSAERSAEPPE